MKHANQNLHTALATTKRKLLLYLTFLEQVLVDTVLLKKNVKKNIESLSQQTSKIRVMKDWVYPLDKRWPAGHRCQRAAQRYWPTRPWPSSTCCNTQCHKVLYSSLESGRWTTVSTTAPVMALTRAITAVEEGLALLSTCSTEWLFPSSVAGPCLRTAERSFLPGNSLK